MSGWNLSQPKFFDKFKIEGVKSPKAVKHQNLIDICDNVYYYWRSSTKTIIRVHSSDISDSDIIDTPYQEWTLSRPIPFHPTHLSVRKTSKEVCLLWGPLGAAFVTLDVNGKQDERVATCEVIGAMIYIMNPRLNIIKAKWHPSTTRRLVMILNNDNFIRTYSPDDPDLCISARSAGPSDAEQFCYNKRNSSSFECTIDFDFGPYLYGPDFWPVFLLKTSGNISYLLMKFIGCTCRTIWEDEKTVALDDTELQDILEQPVTLSVGKLFPLLITIGGLGGNLYHTVLLPSDTEDSTGVNMEESLVSAQTVLFVKEVIVLETEDQLSFIQILPDPNSSYRYACIHQEGVHFVTVNFVPHLRSLLSSDGKIPTTGNTNRTSATCTYLISATDEKDKKSDFVTAAFSDSVPQKLVIIIGNGETLVYDVPKFAGKELTYHDESDNEIGISESSSESSAPSSPNVSDYITSILKMPSNPPYLACPPDMTPDKKENVLLDSIMILQKESIYKQEQALKLLTGVIENMVESIQEVREPLAELQKEQPLIRAKTEELAEKYEELNENQIKTYRRFQGLMSKQRKEVAVVTDEERKWGSKFKEYGTDLQQMKDQVEELGTLAREWTIAENSPRRPTEDAGNSSPRSKISAMELLGIKRELLEHQKTIAELYESIQEVSDNLA